MNRFEELDRYLSESDPNSMGWHEHAHEVAVEQLSLFEPFDWQKLSIALPTRDRAWRMCLVTVLEPARSPIAADLLLEMTGDPDIEIAFEALRRTCFYCGVLTVKGVVCIDPRIQVPKFLSRARATQSLPARAGQLSAQSPNDLRAELAAFIELLGGSEIGGV